MRPTRPHGSITALATPFQPDGELDHGAWRRLLLAQHEAGTQAVVVAGSTGEGAALSDAERDQLVCAAIDAVGEDLPVIVGTGHSSTRRTIEMTRQAADAGADAALVVVPAYVRPTQHGLVAHFEAVADAGGLPVILYNVPTRTGTDLLPETVAQLAPHPNIIGIKEAVRAPERMQALLPLRNEGFAVLSGDDDTAAHALCAGADGVVSVASNVAPASLRLLCDLARVDVAAAGALSAQMAPLFTLLGVEPNPIPLKALLAAMGLGSGLRLPLTPLSPAHLPALDEVLSLLVRLESESRARRTA